MDEFFGVVMVIIAIVSAISKNKKKKVESIRKRAMAPGQPTVEQTLAEWFNVPETDKAAQPAAETVVPTPDFRPVMKANVPEAKQVAQPRVKTMVEVKEKPSRVSGSLGEDTHEGLHPCDEHDDAPMQASAPLAPVAVEQPGIQLDWSGDNLVKAFIMQEVLTRPADRRRRA